MWQDFLSCRIRSVRMCCQVTALTTILKCSFETVPGRPRPPWVAFVSRGIALPSTGNKDNCRVQHSVLHCVQNVVSECTLMTARTWGWRPGNGFRPSLIIERAAAAAAAPLIACCARKGGCIFSIHLTPVINDWRAPKVEAVEWCWSITASAVVCPSTLHMVVARRLCVCNHVLRARHDLCCPSLHSHVELFVSSDHWYLVYNTQWPERCMRGYRASALHCATSCLSAQLYAAAWPRRIMPCLPWLLIPAVLLNRCALLTLAHRIRSLQTCFMLMVNQIDNYASSWPIISIRSRWPNIFVL